MKEEKLYRGVCLTEIRHSGDDYKIDDVVDGLTEKQAKALMDIDAISLLVDEATEKESDAVDPLTDVLNAIPMLDESDKKLWTSDNKPKVEAIERITGFEVSAELRDTAWAEIQKVTN